MFDVCFDSPPTGHYLICIASLKRVLVRIEIFLPVCVGDRSRGCQPERQTPPALPCLQGGLDRPLAVEG